MVDLPTKSERFSFPRRLRLSGASFQRVYAAKTRVSLGPLLFHAAPNELAHPRLGLSISRRVGGAVKRNLIKRRVREAFRLMQHDWPRGYDLVIGARAHAPLTLAEYRDLLGRAKDELHRKWLKKEQRKAANEPR